MRYFVIGAGMWGAIMAERIAADLGQPVTVLEKRDHVGGNCRSERDPETGIECHRYGSHIFHTSDEKTRRYLDNFWTLSPYRHKVLTRHKGKTYAMPINLFTINDFYGRDFTPGEAEEFLRSEIARDRRDNPENLEEKAVSLIGRPLYEAFIKNYTRKQWEKDPRDLPASIINRLPFRTTYNMDYFNDPWQGVPLEGYDNFFRKLLSHPNITVETGVDYLKVKEELPKDAVVVYTGMPDELFDCKFGRLEWRSLRFEWETLPTRDFQGTTVMNYADEDTPFTRVHEFKHYHPERREIYESDETVVCREFPETHAPGKEAYYPVNDARNTELYARYVAEADKNPRLLLGGRLGSYRYWDMDKAAADALRAYEETIKPLAE